MGDEKPCERQRKCECAQSGEAERQKVTESISQNRALTTQKSDGQTEKEAEDRLPSFHG